MAFTLIDFAACYVMTFLLILQSDIKAMAFIDFAAHYAMALTFSDFVARYGMAFLIVARSQLS